MTGTENTTPDRPPLTGKPVAHLTHYVTWDAPGSRLSRAICGTLVDRGRDHDNAPSCPECRAALASLNDLAF